MSDNQPTTPVRAPAVAKARQAFTLRILGGTWDEIAQTVGYDNKANAHRAVREYMHSLPQPAQPDLRTEWRERLGWLWKRSVSDVHEGKPGAVTAAVRVAQAAMRLDALEAPQQVIVHTPTTAELEAWVQHMLALQVPRVVEADILEGVESVVQNEVRDVRGGLQSQTVDALAESGSSTMPDR